MFSAISQLQFYIFNLNAIIYQVMIYSKKTAILKEQNLSIVTTQTDSASSFLSSWALASKWSHSLFVVKGIIEFSPS